MRSHAGTTADEFGLEDKFLIRTHTRYLTSFLRGRVKMMEKESVYATKDHSCYSRAIAKLSRNAKKKYIYIIVAI